MTAPLSQANVQIAEDQKDRIMYMVLMTFFKALYCMRRQRYWTEMLSTSRTIFLGDKHDNTLFHKVGILCKLHAWKMESKIPGNWVAQFLKTWPEISPGPERFRTFVHWNYLNTYFSAPHSWTKKILIKLAHCPVYLGVTADRTLSFKSLIEKTKGKPESSSVSSETRHVKHIKWQSDHLL